MSLKRLQHRKFLKLNEIIDELEAADDDVPFPKAVAILPPENANAEVTDEDSGDEDYVNIQNLPGTQLRAEAEVIYADLSSDDEDDIPLSRITKRRRTVESPTQSPVDYLKDVLPCPSAIPSTSSSKPCSSIPSTSLSSGSILVAPTVSKNQTYKWRNRHNPNSYPEWKDVQVPNNKQPPIYYFNPMFDDGVIQLLVHYTKLYASYY